MKIFKSFFSKQKKAARRAELDQTNTDIALAEKDIEELDRRIEGIDKSIRDDDSLSATTSFKNFIPETRRDQFISDKAQLLGEKVVLKDKLLFLQIQKADLEAKLAPKVSKVGNMQTDANAERPSKNILRL